jgi:four helix bundle protein
MAGFQDLREIAAWRLAHQLNLRVDLFLLSPDFRRHYPFADQLGDAVRSGPRNIAEGFGCDRHREFAHFVRMAKASEVKVLNHLIDAQDQRLITADEYQITEHLTKRAIKAANGLIRYLESTPDKS